MLFYTPGVPTLSPDKGRAALSASSADTSLSTSCAHVLISVGVNGAHSTALKSIATTHAELDGIGLGEFSAWTNNLRAVAGAVASWMYASYYAWCVRRGVFPGSMFMVMGTTGAIIPQLLLWFVTDEELRPIKAKGNTED